MTRAERHKQLLSELRRRDHHTIDGLAERVGTSRRTLIRDIGHLRDQGYCIEAEPGRGGGLALDPRSIVSRPRLLVSEVLALLIHSAVAEALAPLPFPSRVKSAIDKIEASLPADAIRDLRRLCARVHVGQANGEPYLHFAPTVAADRAFNKFEEAFFHQVCIELVYRDKEGVETSRLVEPQGILILPPVWYVVGFDIEKQAFRHFRMDRIGSIELQCDRSFSLRKLAIAEAQCPFDFA